MFSPRLLCLALSSTLACSPVLAETRPPTVEFLNYWISPGEAAAVEVIGEAVRERGGEWVNTAARDYLVMRRDAIERAVSGVSPSGMLVLGGDDIIQLAQIQMIHSLEEHAREHNWSERFHEIALEAVQPDGQTYALPINIHNESWLWINAHIYEELSLQPPDSWQTFVTQAEQIHAAGYSPVSVGDQDWLIHFLFRNIWASLGGIERYRQLYHESDASVLHTPILQETLEIFAALRQWRQDPPPADWLESTQRIIEDKAALLAMGDWAKGELQRAAMQAGTDYYCKILLGQTPFFMAGIDALALPIKEPQMRPDQHMLLDVTSDAQVQIDFAHHKGAIPALRAIETEELDSCNQTAYPLLLEEDTRARISAEVMHEAHRSELQVAIGKFWRDDNITTQELKAHILDIFD